MRDAEQHGRKGRFDEAVRTADRVRRAPADLRAIVVRARAHTAAGRLEEADRAWAEAARRDPNNWRVHFEWAQAVGSLRGDPKRATEIYARARELNPRLPALPRSAPQAP